MLRSRIRLYLLLALVVGGADQLLWAQQALPMQVSVRELDQSDFIAWLYR